MAYYNPYQSMMPRSGAMSPSMPTKMRRPEQMGNIMGQAMSPRMPRSNGLMTGAGAPQGAGNGMMMLRPTSGRRGYWQYPRGGTGYR